MTLHTNYRFPKQRDSLGEVVYRLAKRLLDILVSATALVVLFPVMLVIAVAIKLESHGPVFYTQERVGLNRRRVKGPSLNGSERRTEPKFGRTFKIVKFRSMVSDAERGIGAVWAMKQDPRITRVGAILRRTHLDEVPQFLNVLRGDMSVVGPRPERPEIVERLAALIPGYERRFDVLPGITGLAQVEHCYDRNLQTAMRKLQYDVHYIRQANVLLDLKIMAATAIVMLRAKPDTDPVAPFDLSRIASEEAVTDGFHRQNGTPHEPQRMPTPEPARQSQAV